MRSPANDETETPAIGGDWDEFSRTHELRDARVVAILDEGGGAIVENFPVLEVHEGRLETLACDGKGQLISSLDYGMMFSPKAEQPGDQHTGYEAQIVIRGTATNGRVMEIRGNGTIGYDEHGQLDGVFHELPSVYVPSDEDIANHLKRLTDPEWGGTPTGEFILATYGRAQDWS